jgi:cell division septal protein FtsQ
MNQTVAYINRSTSSYIFRKFRKIIIFTFITGIISIFLYILNTRFLVIKYIEVIGSGVAIKVDLNKFPKSLLFFPGQKVASELLTQYPQLDSVKIYPKFPQTLVIDIRLRTPVAIVTSQSRKIAFAVDGTSLGDATGQSKLTILDFQIKDLNPGDRTNNKQVIIALQIASLFQGKEIVTRISSYDSASIQCNIGKTNIIITQDINPEQAVATLQMLLTRFRMKGTVPALIDLRFDKPVITN